MKFELWIVADEDKTHTRLVSADDEATYADVARELRVAAAHMDILEADPETHGKYFPPDHPHEVDIEVQP